jgi:phosphoenolpyruvate carboxylase
MYSLSKSERFYRNVVSKYHVYNSIFLTLPFTSIDNTGTLLPLFTEACEKGFAAGLSPQQIVNGFSDKYLENAGEEVIVDLMFRFIQYIERQIVLFDAIEDAAFPIVNNLEGKGSLREVREYSETSEVRHEVTSFLENFNIRTVLTAHPTQFYPGSVLGIITDLTEAVRTDDLFEIRQLLSQLGKTPFIKKEKPTPYDEAVSLTWYLENVFYETMGEMLNYIRNSIFRGSSISNPILNLGFWPGGDRDGNPFVTTDITLKVAARLRSTILKCYYRDVRKLKRKLTFRGVDVLMNELELKIYHSVYNPEEKLFITPTEFCDRLNEIKSIIERDHESLYADEVEALIGRLNIFGFHFASLDIRENSRILDKVFSDIVSASQKTNPGILPVDFESLSETKRLEIVSDAKLTIVPDDFSDEVTKSTLESFGAMQTIQQRNGERGSDRYIISNNESALHVMQVLAMMRFCGWENPAVDIIPLFEIIDDLRNAEKIMETLYLNPAYAEHLRRRGGRQTVMLGFSDGTKDGGYLMANWSIYKAKEAITSISRKYGIHVIFFDGRGGPPARGGGKTNKFYASLGHEIENHEIQLTIQGQTISSNFGTMDSCRFNLENLLTAGITNQVFNKSMIQLTGDGKAILDELAEIGYEKYTAFKNHPKFIPYLEQMSTLNYYSKTNIGSRPSKRDKSEKLNFADLRAIPFVGSWSQLKQNVPGFFGVGTALKHFEDSGRWELVQGLYERSLFFRTLLENSMMSLAKSFLPLTAYMKDDPEFGEFWKIISDEFAETTRLLLKIAGHKELMENYPEGKASIAIRERIVLPLLAIQQYALVRIKELGDGEQAAPLTEVYKKIVTRSLFGNINASRNSA